MLQVTSLYLPLYPLIILTSPSSPMSILFPIFSHSLSLYNLHPLILFYPSPTPLSHIPSLYFSPFSLLLSNFSLFTLSLLSLSIALVHSSFLSSFTLVHSSFLSSSFLNFCISCTGISFRKCIRYFSYILIFV